MPALSRNEKVKCGDGRNMYSRMHAARHQKRFISCPYCKNSTHDQQEMNYHVAKKHAQLSSKQSMVCSSCDKEFPSYYSLQQHRRKEHGTKLRKPSDTVADLRRVWRRKGKMERSSKRSCVIFSIFWWIRRWKMGDLRYLTSKNPS